MIKNGDSDTSGELSKGYTGALSFVAQHYENFPVVSFLIPKELRKHIAIIYWFARTADDIADASILSIAEKYFRLADFEKQFKLAIEKNIFENNLWYALCNTISKFELSKENFLNLLTAFNMDVEMQGFDTFDEILNYCSFSANPVGRIILELFNINDNKALLYSDKICTALQLTNFYQDVSKDILQNRIYISRDELQRFSVTEKTLHSATTDNNFRMLMQLQLERVKPMFTEGRKLLSYLSGGLKREIAWTILGGEKIISKIEKNNYDVLNYRPIISKFDLFHILLKSFSM